LEPQILQVALAIASGLLALIFYAIVFRDALNRTIVPNSVSWLIWSLNDTLIFFASLSAGARNTLVVPLVYAIFGWLIFFAALKNERRAPDRGEITCLVGATVGWIAYLIDLGPLISLMIAVLVNAIGAFPIAHRVWNDPKAERSDAWSVILVSSILSLASLERLSPELLLFPLSSTLICAVIVALTLRSAGITTSAKKY
jgi:hypothetical protein